jgi:antitoxin component of MazEF toxin-antitoxin module
MKGKPMHGRMVEVLMCLEGTPIIRPYRRRVYRLKDLLKRITLWNVHRKVDFGKPVGREAL